LKSSLDLHSKGQPIFWSFFIEILVYILVKKPKSDSFLNGLLKPNNGTISSQSRPSNCYRCAVDFVRQVQQKLN
jgi:hypothetical protein